MNNGNIILCCINAQPTTEYSRRELVPLISDGSSAMAGCYMWRHTPLTRGKSPPSPKIDAENLTGRHSSWPKWKRCLVHQHSWLATHSFAIWTTVWLLSWSRELHEVNIQKNSYFLNSSMKSHLVKVFNQGVIGISCINQQKIQVEKVRTIDVPLSKVLIATNENVKLKAAHTFVKCSASPCQKKENEKGCKHNWF